MEQIGENMQCPGCKKEISFMECPPVILQCEHYFCKDCLETFKSESEVIDDFLTVKCFLCLKKSDVKIKQQDFIVKIVQN